MRKIGIIISCILMLAITVCVYEIGFNRGFDAGFDKAIPLSVNATLDTVIHIMRKQKNSDTSVARVVVIKPDTVTYVLSAKAMRRTVQKQMR